MPSKRMFSLIGLLFISLVAADAFAQAQPRQHPTYGKRNIVTPKNTLEINVGPLGNYGGGGITFQPGIDFGLGTTDPTIGLIAGGAYGVHNDLSLGATILPLVISPDFDYGNPSVFGRYRFLHGNFEMAGELTFLLPVQEGSDFALKAGIPVRNRSSSLRIDSGLFITTDFDNVTLQIPLQIMFNVNQDLFVGAITGFNTLGDFDAFSIPVGAGAGYTLQGATGPTADLSASFVFNPGLFLDEFDETDTFLSDFWQVNVGATIFLYL